LSKFGVEKRSVKADNRHEGQESEGRSDDACNYG